jgi:cytochrome c oxidase cbb3-type subunit 3
MSSAEHTPNEHGQADIDVSSGQIMDHSYDGIQEYDNPLPSWWVNLFIICIVFAAGYGVYYHLGGNGKHMHVVYQEEKEALEKLREMVLAKSVKATPETLAKFAKDPALAAKMKPMFVKLCSQCHKKNGAGQIGPNLTDDHQKHGTDRMAIYKTIRDGVPEKGMQAWGKKLKPLDVIRMAAFVSTLRGTKVAGGKAPEGKKIPPYLK